MKEKRMKHKKMDRNAKVWIAAGTTEGRILTEVCRECEIEAVATVVSSYGGEFLKNSPTLTVYEGALNEPEMERLILEEEIDWVVDATHPFAREVTENIKCAAKRMGIVYTRCLRSEEGLIPEEHVQNDTCKTVQNAQEAARFLEETTGNIFLTTGSKELSVFSKMKEFKERVYARVLPVRSSLEACLDVGLSGNHIICMQGPFSKALNLEMFRSVQAQWIVTKESGHVGGFEDKIEAARELGISALIIARPKESGISLEECADLLRQRGQTESRKNQICRTEESRIQEDGTTYCKLFLIGAGMGDDLTKTRKGEQCIEKSQVVFGAGRVLEAWKKEIGQKQVICSYHAKTILTWLEEHSDVHCAAVLYSGDSGFYSGAASLIEYEKKNKETDVLRRKYQLECCPGISSLSYLCAKCQVSWEDANISSFHGRECDLEKIVETHKKVFLLLDKQHTPDLICRRLVNIGMGNWMVCIGERLSYPQERVISGMAKEMTEKTFDPLSVMLIWKETPEKTEGQDISCKKIRTDEEKNDEG